MDISLNDAAKWSEAIFGRVDLGDKRLTKRLVQMGTQLSGSSGSSLSHSSSGDEALLEGGYRFLRNPRVNASQIASGGYEVTSKLAKSSSLLLAIEDTTSLVYSHELSKQLGYTGNNPQAKSKGYQVHSTMLVDAMTERTIGLIAQNRWCRKQSEYGKSTQRGKRAYKDKESYKWEQNTHELEQRLEEKLTDTISVCDRDADVYEYIQYKTEHQQRFVVRACHNRRLNELSGTLFTHLSKLPVLGTYFIDIAQKGHRQKRKAELVLKATRVVLQPPERRKGDGEQLKPVTVNIVYATEVNPQNETVLEWILITSEDISTFEQARKITRYYELRWRIEDFHKAWKSGTNVELLRMQSVDNLEKMIVILSFVAIRLLQLKEYFEMNSHALKDEQACIPCDELLSEIEWKVLWMTVEKKELPAQIPNAAWAFKAIAKLGGWTNSKRTGRAAWSTIWDGWFKLNERIEGFLIAQSIIMDKM